MPSSKPFYTDNMTVSEILDLGDDILSTLSQRDLSRALRTVALAANKRMNRLMQHAYKKHGQFVEKVDSPGIDLHALNKTKGQKFSVGKKNRNQIYQELARARDFMSQRTSTMAGAKEVRKARELAMFGKTREELFKDYKKAVERREKKKISKLNRKLNRQFKKHMKELMEETYKQYAIFEEEYQNLGNYEKEDGRRRFREMGTRILRGEDPDEVRKSMMTQATQEYEQQQEQQADNEPAFWQELLDDTDNDKDNWENW